MIKIKEQIPLLLGWGIALALILISVFYAKFSYHSASVRTVYENILEERRVISQMRIHLLKSVELEKSAVMALTDQESMEYARQSRAASATVDNNLAALRNLIHAMPNEQVLLEEFATCWTEFGKVDQDILQLAVENTNLKAAALSRDKGGEVMKMFEETLDAIRTSRTGTPKEILAAALTYRAMIAALKIFNLHAPHIIEMDDKNMDQLEARMKTEEEVVLQSLAELDNIIAPGKPEEIIEAKTFFAEFIALTTQMVKLSRQNSNFKSLQLSMGKKRNIAAQCDEVLAALQELVKQKSFKATK